MEFTNAELEQLVNFTWAMIGMGVVLIIMIWAFDMAFREQKPKLTFDDLSEEEISEIWRMRLLRAKAFGQLARRDQLEEDYHG